MFSVSKRKKVVFAPQNYKDEENESSLLNGQDALDAQDDEWRLLTTDEWMYLLKERKASTVCGMNNARFLLCTVRGKKGMILFPDDFTMPDGIQTIHATSINNRTLKFNRYQLGYLEYEALKQNGCVFLEAGGAFETYSWSDDFNIIRNAGCYWTSTPDEEDEENLMALFFGEYDMCFNDGTQVLKTDSCGKDLFSNSVRLVKNVRASKTKTVKEAETQHTEKSYLVSINYRNDTVYDIEDVEGLKESLEIDKITAETLAPALDEYGDQGLGSEYSEEGRDPHITSVECIRLITCPGGETNWVEAANLRDIEMDGKTITPASIEFTEDEIQFTPAFYEPLKKGMTIAGVMPECQNNFMLYLEEGEIFDPSQLSVSKMQGNEEGAEMHVEYKGKPLKFMGMGRGDEDRDYFVCSTIFLDGQVII